MFSPSRQDRETAAIMAGMIAGKHFSREKALSLSLPPGGKPPANHLVDEEIRRWFATFAAADHAQILKEKRTDAAFFMEGLRQWNPMLIGPVLSGSAVKNDLPEILLTGNEKEVELFFLSMRIDFDIYDCDYAGRHETIIFHVQHHDHEALVTVSSRAKYPRAEHPDAFQHPLEAAGKLNLEGLKQLLLETNP